MALEKNWSEEFKRYMKFIVNHPNYDGIPFERKDNGEVNWISTKKSKIGRKRIAWAQEKAKELGFNIEPGVYAKVMLQIHPTKSKPCQICGKSMSLLYIYLNDNFAKKINKIFHSKFSTLDSIEDVIDTLVSEGIEEQDLYRFLAREFNLKERRDYQRDEIIHDCELSCREQGCRKLGPGAMSDYPDRLDGFHTYNRCCRREEDTGRHKENMKTYGKDRRAYELWSDGNIHAANKFMTSKVFKDFSADHIGPISLGFKHDPLLLRKMPRNENSSKRNHLLKSDIEELIKIENKHYPFSAMSWFSEHLWLYIKRNYSSYNNLTVLRDILKNNVANYLEILWIIKNSCRNNGKNFLIQTLLKPKFKYFQYEYTFNELGEITCKKKRNITDSTRKEIRRFIRISFDSLEDYHSKENRNLKPDLTKQDRDQLKLIIKLVEENKFKRAYKILIALVRNIEERIIRSFE